MESFEKSVELNPKNADYYFNLGNLYSSIGKLSETISNYNKCLEINKNHLDCLNNLAIAYLKDKRFSEAINTY